MNKVNLAPLCSKNAQWNLVDQFHIRFCNCNDILFALTFWFSSYAILFRKNEATKLDSVDYILLLAHSFLLNNGEYFNPSNPSNLISPQSIKATHNAMFLEVPKIDFAKRFYNGGY